MKRKPPPPHVFGRRLPQRWRFPLDAPVTQRQIGAPNYDRGGGKTSGGGKSNAQTPGQLNRANQLNPNHTQYWASRGLEAPPGHRVEAAKALEQFNIQTKK